jgi:hypothetical protein
VRDLPGRETVITQPYAAGILANAPAARARTVEVGGISFGSYDVFDSEPNDSVATISISDCGRYRIRLDAGSFGDFLNRRMQRTDQAASLGYSHYTDPSRKKIWGDGGGGAAPWTELAVLSIRSTDGSELGRMCVCGITEIRSPLRSRLIEPQSPGRWRNAGGALRVYTPRTAFVSTAHFALGQSTALRNAVHNRPRVQPVDVEKRRSPQAPDFRAMASLLLLRGFL